MSKLYFAYGSNLDKSQMKWRCPDAKAFSLFHLENWKLVFRGVADIVPSPGDYVAGGLWIISDKDELALDRYEGWRPDQCGMYRKETIQIERFKIGKEYFTEIMFYVMNSQGIYPPSQGYLDTIKRGFKDFGLKMKPLLDAVEASWDDKNPSHIERRRHQRNGRPELSPRPSEAKKKKSKTPIVIAAPHDDKPNDKQLAIWRNAMTVYGD